MDLFTHDDLRTLLTERRGPCVSIYMPTHPGGHREDAIRWKGNIEAAHEQLVAGGMRNPQAKEFLASARRLLNDSAFWKNQCGGLAFFLGPQFLRLYRLPHPFDNSMFVGSRFLIKPLAQLLSGDGRFYVLAISQKGVRLLQGARQTISEVDTSGAPRNLADALQRHDRDNMLNFHTRPSGGIGSWGAIFHGHGIGVDDAKGNLLLYFQKIDRAIHPIFREESAPLVLASVGYLQPIYHEANTYPNLLEEGIAGNPDHLSNDQLHQLAWGIVQPRFEKPQQQAAALYERLIGTGRASNDPEEVVQAAMDGRIKALFVAQNRQLWGNYQLATGKVVIRDRPEAEDEDLLDLATASTILHGGHVSVVESENVPGGQLLAAVYRMPMAKMER